jgi:hypothetical protein
MGGRYMFINFQELPHSMMAIDINMLERLNQRQAVSRTLIDTLHSLPSMMVIDMRLGG